MTGEFVSNENFSDLSIWKGLSRRGSPLMFDLEITARCNNNCRHCYINLPAGDRAAKARELTAQEIIHLGEEATELQAVWCLITGGEPLLREDFAEIYLALKCQGLLVSVFTNACLVTKEHVRLFQQYPPRALEVTVYGADQESYERVTRTRGSFAAFKHGLDLLQQGGIRVRLKAMALRSNLEVFPDILRFCRERTSDYARYDPFLHLRYDRDPQRNEEIRAERLSPSEVVALEQADKKRFAQLEKACDALGEGGQPVSVPAGDEVPLFRCGAGKNSFSVGYAGHFRLCSSLCHPDFVYDLRSGSLSEAWERFSHRAVDMTCSRVELRDTCLSCPLIDLCLWCPAHAYLECGDMEQRIETFCHIAHARANATGRRA